MLNTCTVSPILAEKEITFIKSLRSHRPEPICPLSFLRNEIFLCINSIDKVYLNILESMMSIAMKVLIDSIILILVSCRHLRMKSLQDYLIRSKLRPLDQNPTGNRGTQKCTSNRCDVCNYLAVGDSFSSHVTGTSYTVNHRLDCNSRNVVYVISCKVCGLQYVGSTTTKFRLRFNNHKSRLRAHSCLRLLCQYFTAKFPLFFIIWIFFFFSEIVIFMINW